MCGLGELLTAKIVGVCERVGFLFSMCELLFICNGD